MTGKCFKRSVADSGFSLLEAVVMLLLISLILQFLLMLLSQSLKNTSKGTDLLVAIREAHKLFSSIRQNMLECTKVTTGESGEGEYFMMDPGDQILGSPTFSNFLNFTAHLLKTGEEPASRAGIKNVETKYKMVPVDAKNSYIEKSIVEDGDVKPIRKFAVPRMTAFNTLLVKKVHKLSEGSQTQFESRHLFIEIVLKSEDKQKSTREIRLTSFFTPSNLSTTDWITREEEP